MSLRAFLLAVVVALTALALPAWARGPARDDVATIPVSQLPPEARATMALIRQGGPFPHAKDGSIFGNREGRLPREKRGYYREYTVKTPGERTRGARRIVAGGGGEMYYTADHYGSFRRIQE